MNAPKPFRKAVRVYPEERSFVAEGLVPLPRGKKSPPLAGRTGYVGETSLDLAETDALAHPSGNVGFRVPSWLVGFDIDGADHSAGKNGPDAIDAMARRLGALPLTAYSTRHGATSPTRIAFYEIPDGARLSERALESVELIQHHHRFAVVWPSRLRDGSRYRWYDGQGDRITAPLREDIAELPDAWLDALRTEAVRRPAQHVPADDVAAWLDRLPDGEPSPLLRAEMTAVPVCEVGNTHLLAQVGLAARACIGRRGGRAAFEMFVEHLRGPYVEKYNARKFEADMERVLARVIGDMRAEGVTAL
ncbi:bifunctional DNA primase/polymerase [Microbacterium sp.]|uniref:bifunctional DNA primase/polymerase n=1 Tax=Microbacterium sp. TaxID=51671 RepID=UPI003C762B71